MNGVYRDCPIKIQEYEFPGDLIKLSFREFDVILRMDWLFHHQVVVDCRMKRVTLRTPSGKEVTFIGYRSNHLPNVISAATSRMMVWKEREAYLEYVVDTEKVEPSNLDISTVCDYPDMFPEELQGLPPRREINLKLMLFQVPLPHPLHRIEWLRWS